MSRRVGKQNLKRVLQGEGQKSEWRIQSSLWFGWDGDRMVTMQNERQASTTIYEPNSFVPMLRVDKQLQADERRAQGETRTYHVHCNHLGTPEALIAQDSLELVWQIELDPWGQTQREYNPNNMLQPIRMQGQKLDAETGLFYNRYRYYDPAGGRYITQDPIGLLGGANFYAYVEGNPTEGVDPRGLVAIHGNWCGPDWTGGQKESYSKARDVNGYYKNPIDPLDSFCQKHDRNYEQCRINYPCEKTDRKACMSLADRELQKSANEYASSQPWTPQGLGNAVKARIVGNAVGQNPFPPVGDDHGNCTKTCVLGK
jgi:RHS repeat-associated protein